MSLLLVPMLGQGHVKIVGTDVSSMDEAIRSLREAAKASPVPHAKATAKAKAAMQKNRFARTHMQNLMLRRVPENHRVSVEVDATWFRVRIFRDCCTFGCMFTVVFTATK